ncbi:MAG: hypothetical protein UY48_C0018G0005 [Candidatus Gottesmanbacteria bacterium GW2011_GWB1_49_7]|uniref:Uncharacterized protein n=1 Tax=Candidatus Gottesmanbacteria bacterium GW2011_GWB1_49_7 TaxID=1618448 RepID=A0A0G1VYC2_9BACT|nr:MAG: hypothetical protein UY48_C0018G0005 [Candidatus Gottesmanbacteria bacterium GW2011_GWB1_49_7]
MVLLEFKLFVEKLTTFYERKPPSNRTMDLWFEAIKAIPHQRLDVIYQRITKDLDTWPKNLTGQMWTISGDTSNQSHETHYKDCAAGCDEGLLFMEREEKPGCGCYRYVFRCDQCKQRMEKYPWGNIDVLIKKGYRSIYTEERG